MSKISQILSVKSFPDYVLLDSGDGEKLERFGKIVLSRPDPQALWAKKLSPAEWKKADGYFSRDESGGKWALKSGTPAKWEVSFGGLKFWIKPTAFKHTGLFPEQEVNWGWLRKVLGEAVKEREFEGHFGLSEGEGELAATSPEVDGVSRETLLSEAASNIEVLNLFGYTGGATLACAQAGAKVVHIDSSKAAVTWARENAEISGLKDAPIRWIIEDARLFVEREIKRGRKYDAIIMDPPAFGHGPTSELWKIEENFLPLVENCMKLLSDKPLFFLINGYSAGYSAVAYENVLLELVEKYSGEIEVGELTIEEEVAGTKHEAGSTKPAEEKKESQARLLPAGIFARWFVK